MSRSPYFFVEKFDNHTNQYELQHPIVWNYDHTKKIVADLFPYNGCHDLFSIVENKGYGNAYPEMKGIQCGLPKDVCKEIKDEYSEYEDDWKPDVHWFTYADMYIYCLEHPKAVDYEATDNAWWEAEEGEKVEDIMTDSPMFSLKHRIDAFLEVMDDFGCWKDEYSQIRIVYWIN